MDFEGNTVFAISCAVDAVLALVAARAVLAGRPVIPVAIALGGVLALKGMAMVSAGLDVFGVAHVLWLDLVVVVPLAAAVLVLRGRGAKRVVACGALLLAPIGAYASFVEPERLVVERADVMLDERRGGTKPIRVAVLSDLQFERIGEHERDAVARVMRERPDLVLLTGDFHQGSPASREEELPAIKRLLGELRAPAGVFAVRGDQEGVAEARRVLEGTGVTLLVNETARVRVHDRDVAILGLALEFWAPEAYDATQAFEARRGDREVRLLLAHRPDVVNELEPGTRVDLVVAGHTHGGQIQLPVIGPPFTSSDLPRNVAAGGLHELDGRRLYVSRGVGLERGQAPRLRLGAVPEVSILTLR